MWCIRRPRAPNGPAFSLRPSELRRLQILRQKTECGAVARPDGAEMPLVKGDDVLCVQALGKRNNRGVGATKGKVTILSDEFRDPRPLVGQRHGDIKSAQPGEEAGLDIGAEPGAEQVRDLGDDHGRYDEMQIGPLQGLR